MTETIQNVTVNSGVADDGYGMLMPAGGYISAAITLFFIGFFGFFLNLSVIVLMWKDKQVSDICSDICCRHLN